MRQFPEWASMLLKLAGVTNAFWGLTFALFPDTLFRWAGIADPTYLFPWQMIGVIAIIFGVFYYAAAFNPRRHIMIIGMGFVSKATQLIFIVNLWANDLFPPKLFLYFLAKDLIWLFPLAVIMYLIFRLEQTPKSLYMGLPFHDILERIFTNRGENLKAITDEQPVLLIFLRHFGCASCHQALVEISEKRRTIESKGVRIILTHMASYDDAAFYLNQYALRDLSHISDPNCDLYTVFRLDRLSLRQLFKPKSFKIFMKQDIVRRQYLDHTVGDRYRMPGTFLVYKGELLKVYKHTSLQDQPDLVALASV